MIAKVADEMTPAPSNKVNCCRESLIDYRRWALKPKIKKLGSEHEETYLELFYDLIIVVVFMRLGTLLRREPTTRGVFVVFTLYSVFWSQWCLFSYYVTMLDSNDIKHRFLYIAHILSVFFCGIFILHEDSDGFSVELSGIGMSGACAVVRFILAVHWGSEARVRKNFKEGEWGQITMHTGTLLLSATIFFVGLFVADREQDKDIVVVLWLLAVIFEQVVSIYLLNFGDCSFDANYYGERMSTWLMLTFGESVISLLNTEFSYTTGMVLTVCSCFIFIAVLCVHYFDIVDCDQCLKHFVFESKQKLACVFMGCHCLWSFCILLVGIGLQGVMYVDLSIEKRSWIDDMDRRHLSLVSAPMEFRRLEGMDIQYYEQHLKRYFYMIEYGTFAHFLLGNGWHSLRTPEVTRVKYSDIGVPHWRVWTGRITSTLCILFIPFTRYLLKCFKCDPYYNNASEYDDKYEEGLNIHEALLVIVGVTTISLLLSTMMNQWKPMSHDQLHRYHGHHSVEESSHAGSASIRSQSMEG